MTSTKPIELHRHFNMVEMSQEDPSVKAWLGEAYKPIGPYFDGKTTGTGLNFAEQNLLMPYVLGVESSDKDFRRVVTKFFDELLIKIDKEGTTLETGLADNTKALSEDNMPLNIKEYVEYRFALKHPHVGRDRAEAERGYTKKFYIIDPNKVADLAIKINTLEDKASSLYFKYKDDLIKTHQILTMLGVNVQNMKKDEQTLKLKDLSRKNPRFGETEQTEAFRNFINVCEDKDLEMKYLIEEMIGAQYLKKVGTNIVLNETGQVLGENLQDTVIYFQNAKNSRALSLLKAEYQLKIKQGDGYLPQEQTNITSTKTE